MTSKSQQTTSEQILIITSIIGMIVGVLIAVPTADFITVLIGIGIVMIPLVVVIILTRRIINRRNIEFSPLITMITGCGIGLLTGFLSVALFYAL